jgi:AraC-like DNA-binding protein
VQIGHAGATAFVIMTAMQDTLSKLAELLVRQAPREGLNATSGPGVYCTKFSRTDQRTKRHWRACLSIAAQGCKEIVLGRTAYRIGGGRYSVTPVDLPVVSRVVEASARKPLLVLMIDLNPIILSEAAAQFPTINHEARTAPAAAVFTGETDDEMLEAALRLTKLLERPEEARAVGPLIVKEMLYYLLRASNGASIRQFVRADSKTHRVSLAIHRLNAELDADINVVGLANAANMSRSAFFKHFKEATSMSPIQYQKRLRLLEARRLMIDEGETAQGSAFAVGYKSASQFSREYFRMFNAYPMRDVARARGSRPSLSASRPGQRVNETGTLVRTLVE